MASVTLYLVYAIVAVVNPRRMRKGYGSRFVCVCVCVCLSVCYRTSCYIPCLYVQIEAS